jgi:hypothetical protein
MWLAAVLRPVRRRVWVDHHAADRIPHAEADVSSRCRAIRVIVVMMSMLMMFTPFRLVLVGGMMTSHGEPHLARNIIVAKVMCSIVITFLYGGIGRSLT